MLATGKACTESANVMIALPRLRVVYVEEELSACFKEGSKRRRKRNFFLHFIRLFEGSTVHSTESRVSQMRTNKRETEQTNGRRPNKEVSKQPNKTTFTGRCSKKKMKERKSGRKEGRKEEHHVEWLVIE